MTAPSVPVSRLHDHADAALLGVGLVLLATTVDPTIHSDGVPRYEAALAILEGDWPAIKFSLVQPLLATPLLVVASLLALDGQTLVEHFNIIVFMALAGPIWWRLAAAYGRGTATRALLLLLAASMLPYHLRHHFGEPLSAMAIGAAFLWADRRPYLAIGLVAIGVGNSPPLLVPVGAAALVLARVAPALLAGTVAGAGIVVGEGVLKYGNLLGSPYLSAAERGHETVLPYSGRPGFSYPLFFGLLSVVFSFGKGLLWFIPGLLTMADRTVRDRLGLSATPAGRALLVFAVSIVTVYSGWWAWYGGNYWGPRFFLILCLPAALGLAIASQSTDTPRRAAWVLVLLALSFWVGLNGMVFEQRTMDLCWDNDYQLEFLCWYVPEFSALWQPFVTHSWSELGQAVWQSDRRAFALWQMGTWVWVSLTTWRTCRRPVP